MAVLFDFYESPVSPEDKKPKKFHARPVLSSVTDTEDIIRIIHERSSLSKGDVLSTLKNLSRVLSEKLQDGQRVHIDGIGYFHITLSCSDIHTSKDMRANNVRFKSITFRADKELKNDLMKIKFKRSTIKGHSARLSTEEVDRILMQHFDENPILTRKTFEQICQVTRMTATRHINRLLEEGKLKNINTKRQPIYILTLP